MAFHAINSSAVSVISTATKDAHRDLREHASSDRDNSTVKGNDKGMKSKDKRNETLELHTGPIQSYAEDTSADHTPSQDEIRLRAYEIHLERGDVPGNDLDDWLQAERELERPAPKAERFSIKRASE